MSSEQNNLTKIWKRKWFFISLWQGSGKQSSAFLHVRKRGIWPAQDNAKRKEVCGGLVCSWKHELHFRVPVVARGNAAGMAEVLAQPWSWDNTPLWYRPRGRERSRDRGESKRVNMSEHEHGAGEKHPHPAHTAVGPWAGGQGLSRQLGENSSLKQQYY